MKLETIVFATRLQLMSGIHVHKVSKHLAVVHEENAGGSMYQREILGIGSVSAISDATQIE
jgi:hypothetical protein